MISRIFDNIKNLRIGLALGGGAVRGASHLGVLSVFEEEGIPISMIAGTSAGAIVGGNYALMPSSEKVFKKLREALYRIMEDKEFHLLFETAHKEEFSVSFSDIRNFFLRGMFYASTLRRSAYIDEEKYESLMSYIIDDVEISSLVIPFLAVAVDVKSGKDVIIKEGSLRKAVMASSAIPGVFPPVKINGGWLVDGGWVHPVPVLPLREHVDLVVAVDISVEIKDVEEIKRGLNIIFRTNAITREYLKRLQLQYADVVIRPAVGDIHWADVEKFELCYYRGVEAGRKAIDILWEKIKEIKRFRRRR